MFSSDGEIHSLLRQHVDHTYSRLSFDKYHISGGQARVLEKQLNVQKAGSNNLKGNFNPRSKMMAEFNGIYCGKTGSSSQGTSRNSIALDINELNGESETVTRIELGGDTMVIYLPRDGSDIESEHELVICQTPDYEYSNETDQLAAGILGSMTAKPLYSNGPSLHSRIGKNCVVRVLDDNIHRNNESNGSNTFKNIASERMGEVKLVNGLTPLNAEILTSTEKMSLDTNLVQHINYAQSTATKCSLPGFSRKNGRSGSKQPVELIRTDEYMANALSNVKTSIHSLQPERDPSSTRLSDNPRKKLKNGLAVGNIPCFSHQGKTGQTAEDILFKVDEPTNSLRIAFNIDKPTNVDSTESVITENSSKNSSVSTICTHSIADSNPAAKYIWTNNFPPSAKLVSSRDLNIEETSNSFSVQDETRQMTPPSGAGTNFPPQTVTSSINLNEDMDLEPLLEILCSTNLLKENIEEEKRKSSHHILGAAENSFPSTGMSSSYSKKIEGSSASAFESQNKFHDTNDNKAYDNTIASNDLAAYKRISPQSAEKIPTKIIHSPILSSSFIFTNEKDLKQTEFTWTNNFTTPVKTVSPRLLNTDGNNFSFSPQDKTVQTAEGITLNYYKPPNVELESTESAITTKSCQTTNCPKAKAVRDESIKETPFTSGAVTNLSPQPASSNRKLSNEMDSELSVGIVCSSDRLKENPEDDKADGLKSSVKFIWFGNFANAVKTASPRLVNIDGNNRTFSPQDITVQTAEGITLNYDKPPNVELKSTEPAITTNSIQTTDFLKENAERDDLVKQTPLTSGAVTKLSPQTASFDRKLSNDMGQELSVGIVCSSDRLKENPEHKKADGLKPTVKFIWSDNFATPMKTASLKHANIDENRHKVSLQDKVEQTAQSVAFNVAKPPPNIAVTSTESGIIENSFTNVESSSVCPIGITGSKPAVKFIWSDDFATSVKTKSPIHVSRHSFSLQDKAGQSAESIASNVAKPPSTGVTSTESVLMGNSFKNVESSSVGPNGITDSKPIVKFIWSDNFNTPEKTASRRDLNIDRAVKTVSEHANSSIKNKLTSNMSFQGKRSQLTQSPKLNQFSSLERKRLCETDPNETVIEPAITRIEQTVQCVFPWFGYKSTSSSKRSRTCQFTPAIEFDSQLNSKLASEQRTKNTEIGADAQLDKNGCSLSDISSETVAHDSSYPCPIPEPVPQTKCQMYFETADEDDVRHLGQCEIIATALELRDKRSSMLQLLPSESSAEKIVDQIVGNCVCKDYLLGKVCSTDHSNVAHNVQLNFDAPDSDLKTSFNVFSRWYFSNSKQPNLKVLLHLLSLLSRDFGDELLISILCFSPALFMMAQNFRRPLGIKLVEKLVHLMDFTKNCAIRTIILFNLTNSTEESVITDILNSLGVYEEEMDKLFESISCIWHINPNYSFAQNVFFAMLKECLQEMPPHFRVAKDKIIVELMKYPRSVLIKQYHIIERILLKYYALNSFAAYKVRSVVFYGKILEPDPDRKKGYTSSRVKTMGPINRNWQYWDATEERHKSVQLAMGRICLENEIEEEVCDPLELSTAPGFEVDELTDDVVIGQNLNLLTTLLNCPVKDTTKYVRRIQNALECNDYKKLIRVFNSQSVQKSLDTYLDELFNMLKSLNVSDLPLVVFGILIEIKLSLSETTGLWIKNKFTVLINSLVLEFYKCRDYKSAFKLLKTLRVGEVNPVLWPPAGVDEETFEVICSEIHFDCISAREALRILLSGKSLYNVRFSGTTILSNHFYLLERLVVKLFKKFIGTRRPNLAVRLFRTVLFVQNNLHFPIDISLFYERVICYSFIDSRSLYDGVNLYVTVQRSCRNEVIFRSTTYRSLVAELVRTEACDDIIRRILQICLHFGVYPAFTPHVITLGTNLLEEEMYIYLFHCFNYFLVQDRLVFMQHPCSIHLMQHPKPKRGHFPFLKDLQEVSTLISEAMKRFEEALRRIVGDSYPNLLINIQSPSEVVIPAIGMEVLAKCLLNHKK